MRLNPNHLTIQSLVLLSLALLFSSAAHAERTPAQLLRVVDGDTIIVRIHGAKEPERVRLIGIDCPEGRRGARLEKQSKKFQTSENALLHLAQAATRYVEKSLARGKLELEFDVQPRDRYQRLLAYVWVDGQHLNLRLVEEGLATVYTVPPNVKYQDHYLVAQRRARREKRGLWR